MNRKQFLGTDIEHMALMFKRAKIKYNIETAGEKSCLMLENTAGYCADFTFDKDGKLLHVKMGKANV